MIPLEEIEILAKKILGQNVFSVRQINKATIRVELINVSFIDVFQSVKDSTKFAFHAKLTNGKIYRLDCRPERKYTKLKSFPWHFHREKEENIVLSPFSSNKRIAINQFFRFIKDQLGEKDES